MTRPLLIAFCLSLCLVQFCNAEAFSPDSFLAAVKIWGQNALAEYDIEGTRLQAIYFPVGLGFSGSLDRDSTGGIILVTMYKPIIGTNGDNSLINYGCAYNRQGELVNTTSLTSQPWATNSMAMDSQDTWFAVGPNVVHQTFGDTGVGVTITSASSLSHIQLVGTQLWALDITGLYIMDPVLTSESGSLNMVLSGEFATFYLHNGSFLYVIQNKNLKKYAVGPGASLELQYSLDVTNLAPLSSITRIDVSDDAYLLCVGADVKGSYIYRFIDTGTALTLLRTVVNATSDSSALYILAVGSFARPTCSDALKNQDETDIDCGGAICSSKCANTKSCALSSDCTSDYCNPNNVCSTPSCSDGFENQDETDIDCGGSICSDRCSLNQQCNNDSDCASNSCSNSVCVSPPVAVPVVEPVAVPVNAPANSPESTVPADTAPNGVPVYSPESKTPIASPVNTPINAPSALPSQTPVRNSLVSPAVALVASVIGAAINFILLII